MTIRSDWKLNTTRRNYRGDALGVLVRGNVPLARRTSPTKAWQRDVSRGMATLKTVRSGNPDDAPSLASEHASAKYLPEHVRRLKELARSMMHRASLAARDAVGAAS